jgi:hypothetical protein
VGGKNPMRKRWVFGLILCLALAVQALAQTSENSQKEKEGLAATDFWLKLVDSKQYDQSWKEASDSFRNAVSSDQWVRQLEMVRTPLGSVETRKVKAVRYTRQIPGLPDGDYVIVQYDTTFDRRSPSVETLVPMKDKDGEWRVSGYYIK